MSSYPNLEVLTLIKELVSNLTNFKEGSPLFNHVENYIINCVQNADSMVFLKKKDIDRSISSLSDKFIFHGFSIQANDLMRHYENFLPNSTPKNLCESKLNTIKFLLCLAESPTSIERWSPPPGESSDDWSEMSESDSSLTTSPEIMTEPKRIVTLDEIDTNDKIIADYESWKESGRFLGIFRKGLINIKRSNIIPEYCVLREIIWQCFISHNSFVFNFVGDKLLPKENVTIASVRPITFQTFLNEFLPYIELLHEFQSFHESLFEDEYVKAPDTYRSYDNSLRNFLKPLFDKMIEIEREILRQTSTFTLLKLANEFKQIFETTNVLRHIHHNIVLDFKNNEPLVCVTTLLSRLHHGLVHCVSKNELDIYLTLYLESLFKYLTIINSWLGNDTLIDVCGEFIIKKVNTNSTDTSDYSDSTYFSVFTENVIDEDKFNWNMGFIIREISEMYREDSIFKLIITDVLQIGKNIHFLRLLKKLYLLEDITNTESLYDELISRVLKKISSYFNHDIEEDRTEMVPLENKGESDELQFKFPAICPDHCKYPTEMDKLENLVDTSDGFLMLALKNYFVQENEEPPPNRNPYIRGFRR
ncbi:gamma tubulin complex protein [Holotrichia oblita]|uniref:Gamma tubulin complex protein n=1 Tax=Holotrichia oblita TaxID=644536 RepID=A0ACB9SR66_HOLOL|nr:gamma tubulin complex protein [Holotrichia oblita]